MTTTSVVAASCMSSGSILLESEVFPSRAFHLDQYYGDIQKTIVAFLSAEIPSIGYLRVEFPSEFWSFQGVATTVTHSLARAFVDRLPQDKRIEHVYWFAEDDTLKIWTVIPEPDFSLEEPIYEAQMFFMEKFPEYECDFSVIYRFGKPLDNIKPQGAHQIL